MKATELIKPEEIRVGNCLNYVDIGQPYPLPYNVDWESIKECTHNNKSFNERHKPIELTEELLLRAGHIKEAISHTICISRFPNTEYKRLLVDVNQGIIAIRNGEMDAARHEDELITIFNSDMDGKLYLHTYQNIYNSLTGKELTLN